MKVKYIIAMLMLVVCTFILLPTAVSADGEKVRVIVTGDPTREQPSKSQVVAAYESVTQFETVFDVEPSLQVPYATGKLNETFLQNGLDYLNYIRYVSRLPEVQLDEALTENAQYGAVLGAVHLTLHNQLTHYPPRPADMDLEFYSQGYQATSTSNISYGYGSLARHIQGCMDDSDSNNLEAVGHRRWLLSSQLKNVGFGFAVGVRPYAITKVLDFSGPELDFDLISWPASGNMIMDHFGYSVPWSITVNTDRYILSGAPEEIRVTNHTTGEIWIFDESTPSTPSGNNRYFLRDSSGIGDYWATTYIFRPEIIDKRAYHKGVYTVEIRGWADRKEPDQPLVLTYDVEIFDPESYQAPTIIQHPQDQYVKPGDVAKVKIKASGWGVKYNWWIQYPNSNEFVPTNETFSEYSMEVTPQTNGTKLYCQLTDEKGAAVNSNVVTIYCIDTTGIPGDVDGSGTVNNRDVEYLLWHTLFPEEYPLVNSGDFDGNKMINNKDVEYLLWHTLFPEDYPIV